MVKPKLVLFDFGGTLIVDGEFKLYEGMEALRLAADNSDVVTTEYMCNLLRGIESTASGRHKGNGGFTLEIQLSAVLRNIFARSGLQYSLGLTECEAVFDRFNSLRTPTPYIEELIGFLNHSGIRTGVISNTVLSGEAMAITIHEHIPQNRMEFILTSADYLLCKPASDMFEAAVKMAGVTAGECWYCGDSIGVDVDGAHSSGMLPVLYDRKSDVSFAVKERNGKEYFVVNNWRELIKRLAD